MGEAALWPIKQWSINQTIWAGTGMGLAALLSLGTVSLVNLHRFQQANDSVQHTQEVERAIQELLSSLQDAETGQRGYLLTGQSSYLQPYRTALGQIQLQVDALTELTADNPRQQARLAGLQPLIQSKLAELADTIARHDQQGYEAALLKVRTNQGKVAMDQIRRIIQEMEREELLLLVQHRAVKPQIVDQTLGITGLISLVGAASFIATAWLLNRNLARRRQVEAMQWASVEAATAAHCRVVQILESITDGFVALDQNWRYTYVNQQAGEMLNRAPAELVGKQIWEEFPEGVGQKFYQVYHRAMSEQKPVQLEEYYPPWNRWFENRIYPSAEGLTIFFQDSTIRKQAELALQQSEENFRQLAESVREVFFISILDKTQPFPQVLYVNPAFEQIWGQPCEQLYQDSQLWLNSIHPEDRESVQADLARQLQGEELCHQYRITKPDGETRWISTRTFFVEGNADHPIRIVGVAEDITERKQTEIALQHAKEFLEQEVIKRTAELRQSNQQLQQELARRRQTEAALRESEARFRSAFDDAAIGMALVAPVGHWLRVNPALCNLIGYTEAELLQRSFRSVTHPEDLEIDRPYIHQLLTDDIQAYQIEKRYIHQQGHIISTLLSVSLVRDAANHPLYFVVQVQDISQRKQAEEELRQEKQFTERLIHSSVDGIAAFDLNYRHTLWNPGMERFFQINAEQALGKTHFELFPQFQDREESQYLVRTLAGEKVIGNDGTYILPETGETGYFQGYFSPLNDEAGKIVGGLVVLRDVTDRHRLEQLKSEFVAMVSHELRTPLTSIHGGLNLLATGLIAPQSDRGQHTIRIAAAGAERLVRIVNDILDLERLESGKLRLVRQPCQISDLVQQAVDVMQVAAIEAQITIQLAIQPSVQDAVLEADPDRIVQVLTNLLSNAIKFSPAGSTVQITGQIKTQIPDQSSDQIPDQILDQIPDQAASSLLQITVQDEGRGIPADQLDSIFERFKQVDVSDARQKGGTGLGLAICRSIVQQHGGEIWADQPGQGSRFHFTLPMPDRLEPEGAP